MIGKSYPLDHAYPRTFVDGQDFDCQDKPLPDPR